MGKTKKRSGGGGGGGGKAAKDGGGKRSDADAMVGSDDDGPEFDDAFEDEFIVEEPVGGDGSDDEEDARMDEAGALSAIAADLARDGDATATACRDPRENTAETAGDLECDPRAYRMLHRLGSDWPCLSFAFVPDGLGGGRTRFPHSVLAACGSQAADGDHRLTLLKLEGLGRMEHGDSDDSESEDSDDGDGAGDQIAESVAFAHPGCVNRVAASRLAPGILATWSEDAAVRLWDARAETAGLLAPPGSGPRPAPRSARKASATAARAAEGYALAFSPASAASLACGGNDGSLAILAGDGDLRATASWRAKASVEDVAFSPTEATVLMACGGAAASLSVYDARHAGKAMLTRPNAHGGEDANALSWNSAVAYLVATAGDDGVARVWNPNRFKIPST